MNVRRRAADSVATSRSPNYVACVAPRCATSPPGTPRSRIHPGRARARRR